MKKAMWNKELLDEFQVFPFQTHDDIVDACSDAFNYLTTKNTRKFTAI